MYSKPMLERLGTFREVTRSGVTLQGGDTASFIIGYQAPELSPVSGGEDPTSS